MKTLVGRWAPMVVVPAMVIALAGCNGDDDKKAEKDDEKATDTPSATDTSSAPTITPQKLRKPPTLKNAEGGVADVDWDPSKCKTETGTQTVEGTVTNPAKKATDYVITISWTNDTSDTLGLGFATVKQAKPKTKTAWKLRAEVPDGATQCVINVLHGTLASKG